MFFNLHIFVFLIVFFFGGCPFCRLEVHGSYLLWGLLPVGGVGPVAYQGFLVEGVCICVLVGGSGSLLSGMQ